MTPGKLTLLKLVELLRKDGTSMVVSGSPKRWDR